MTLSRKDFILLAEELAQSKLYYKSPISYNEQLERLTAYCIKSNPRFDKTRFIAFIDKTYKNLVKELEKKIGGSIWVYFA